METAEGPSAARRIGELEAAIADLEKRMPAHSVPPALLIRLEELEEELARVREAIRGDRS